MSFYVYIIYSNTLKRYYIGQTVNVQERIKQHNNGYYDEASTKIANDWELFWKLECMSKKQAIQIESHIKRMRNKTYYNNLKRYPEISAKLMLRYAAKVPGSPR